MLPPGQSPEFGSASDRHCAAGDCFAGVQERPGHVDEVLYSGHARHTVNLWTYIRWASLSALGGGLSIVAFMNGWFPEYRAPLAGLWFIGGPGMLFAILVHRNKRYTVTRRRVETENGVLTKKIDTLELWRVLDVRYQQSVVDRILGDGKITLIGTDRSDAVLELHGLPGHRKIFESLRDAVQWARRNNRPLEFVPGHGLDSSEVASKNIA